MPNVYETYSRTTSANSLEHAKDSARVAKHFHRHLLPILQREGCALEKARIFEFGAGWGRNLQALRSLGGKDLRGVDISQEQVELAHRLGMDSITLTSPEEDLGLRLEGERFDLILVMDVLEHLSLRQIEILAETIQKIVSPSGLIVIQVPNDLAPLNPVRFGDLTHLRAFTVASVKQFFELANVQSLSIKGVPFPGSGIPQLLRSALVTILVAPLTRFVSFLLYGRNEEKFVDPNLLAVGRHRSVPR